MSLFLYWSENQVIFFIGPMFLFKILLLCALFIVANSWTCNCVIVVPVLEVSLDTSEPCDADKTCSIKCPCGKSIYYDLSSLNQHKLDTFKERCHYLNMKTHVDQEISNHEQEIQKTEQSKKNKILTLQDDVHGRIQHFEKNVKEIIQPLVTLFLHKCRGESPKSQIEKLKTTYEELVAQQSNQISSGTEMIYQNLIQKVGNGEFEFCPCSLIFDSRHKKSYGVHENCKSKCSTKTNTLEDELSLEYTFE
jgi:hypothetical protein